MENVQTFSSLVIGAVETGCKSIVADRLAFADYLYMDTKWLATPIRWMKDNFTTAELKALHAAGWIGRGRHNLIRFDADLTKEIIEIAKEEGIKIK